VSAEETKEAIRKAMKIYETMVLDARNWDGEKEVFRYPHRVSEVGVLRLAGVKSRSTLSADYHADIKVELARFIEVLKVRTGKGAASPAAEAAKAERTSRLEQLAQTIAAQDYKIRALQQELDALKGPAAGKVTDIRPRRA
jgi:hypothetical protein